MILLSSAIICMRHGTKPLENGAIVVSRGIIQAVGPTDKIIIKYPGHRIHRLGHAVLMPGLINVHTHLELPPLLGKIRSRTYPNWVLNLIQAKRKLSEKDYHAAATNNIETLIECGTTTVGEICAHNVSPSFLKHSGLRGIVFREIISMAPSGPRQRLDCARRSPRCRPLLRHGRLAPYFSSLVPRPSSLITTGISPHAPHTVSEHVLRGIKQIARQKNLFLSMHVAESKDEIRLLQGKRSGLEKLYHAVGWDTNWAPSADSPFEYLLRLGLLNSNFLAVHAVQVTDDDINFIKKSHAAVVHCPRSNNELGVGRMPLKKFLDAGITVGLGTDSLASSPSLNLWDEMRYAYRIHRSSGIAAKDILRLATIGGAKALGMEQEIGSLEPGKKADIIAVPLPRKDTGDICSDLLRETKSCIMSMVNGKVIFTAEDAKGRF